MNRRISTLLLAAAVTALSACGPADNDPGPGGVTVGEARALDEAAEMLEERRIPDEAIPEADGENALQPPAAGTETGTQ